MEQRTLGDVCLKFEIKNGSGTNEVKGTGEDILIAWLMLGAGIADRLHIPISGLFAMGAALGPMVEQELRAAEVYRIDLSGLGR